MSDWTRPVASLANAARTSVIGLTMRMHILKANVWRDQFNPLRGLTMNRAVSYLEEGERGAYADLQWLFRYIEKRDAVLRGGKRSLLGAVTEMDWDIKVVEEERLPPGYTKAQAEAQAVTLRTDYDAVSNLTDALEFLALAEFRGFAHLERIVDALGTVVKLLPVEQWYWCRDGLNGQWTYNAQAMSGQTVGESVDLNRFIIREIDDPIDEIALIAFVRKQLGRKDEDGFIESFGVPSIFAIMPQNVPAGREAEYQELAEAVIGDSRGALPHGADIKTVDVGARGVAPFRDYQKALNEEIVMAITSGQLTMLAESGSGTLAGGAHSETFMRVARALARRISMTMQQQFDLEILQNAHPGQPPLAYFEILCNEETDVGEVVKDVQTLKAAGYAVDLGWLEEKTGYPVIEAQEGKTQDSRLGLDDVPMRNQALMNRSTADEGEAFLQVALAMLQAGEQMDFKPLAVRLQNLLEEDLSEEEFKGRLVQLRADLPGLAGEVAGGAAMVTAWEAILGAAAGEGLATINEDDEE